MHQLSFLRRNINTRWRLSGYSWLVIFLGVVLIVSMWLYVRYRISHDYERTMAEASQETMNMAIAFEEHVRRIVADVDKDLLQIKQAYEQDGLASPIVAGYMRAAPGDPARSQVAVYDEQGRIIASSVPAAVGVDGWERDYFQAHRQVNTQPLFVGRVITGRVASQAVIPVTIRLNRSDGSFGGIAYIDLLPDYFVSFYDKIDLGRDQLISLIGTDGFVRARQYGDSWGGGQNIQGSTLWEILQTGRDVGSYSTPNALDGVNRINSFRVMPEYPLIVAVGKSTQVALAGYEARRQGYLLGASLASLVIVIFCGLLINRHEKIETHNWQLQAKEEELLKQRDRLQAINAVLEDEVAERQAAQHELRGKNAALAAREAHYRSLFDNMQNVFSLRKVVVDDCWQPVDLIYIEVNQAFEALYGIKPADVVGKTYKQVFPAFLEEPVDWIKELGEVALTGKPKTFVRYVRLLNGWYRFSAYRPEPGFVAMITIDVTTKVQAEEAQRCYAEEIAATNAEIKSFVNMIAHDFRTPMVNLKGFSAELGYILAELRQAIGEAESLLSPEIQAKVDELFDKDIPQTQQFIDSSVDRLHRMVETLLTLARMGRRDLNPEEVDLGKLVKDVLQSYQHQVGEGHIQVDVGALPTLETDRLTLEQIIGNLVDNAIKYLVPGRPGKIGITCSEDEAAYVLCVKDNGRGIAVADFDKIFEPFRRAGRQDQPGEGLGLAYVRTLLRKLGGKIWCESEVGIGTTMSFTIPKKPCKRGDYDQL